MQRDLAQIKEGAQLLALHRGHEEVLLEHFLCVLLGYTKFQQVFQDFFQEYSTTVPKVMRRLDRHLSHFDVIIAGDSKIKPPFTPQCIHLFQDIETWLNEDRHGYCLPFICLAELFQIDSQSYVGKLLRRIGIDTADLLGELSHLEIQRFDDLPSDYHDSRSLEEKQAGRRQRELLRLSEAATRFAFAHSQRYLLPEHLLLAFLTMPKFQPYLRCLPPHIDQEGLKVLRN